jgi:PAS domain S-box-containing protein
MIKIPDNEEFYPLEAAIRVSGFAHWLLEGLADGVIACDADGRLNLFNDTARQWFGGDFEGVSLDDWATLHPCRDDDLTLLPVDQCPLVRAFRGEKLTNVYVAMATPDKPARFFRVSGGPILDAERRKLGAVMVMCDVTGQKPAGETMLRSEQRLRLHLEKSPLGFLEWDENFCANEWNAACERIFGYTREEAIGRHAKDLILPPQVHHLVDGIYESLMNQTADQHHINENVTKDGRIITCEWFCTTLIDKEGKAIGVASLCRDITEQKMLEDELSGYREHLEALVEERTAALQAANKELEAFTSSVSHDLHAPLRHIEGFIDLLEKHAGPVLDEQCRHYMANISDSASKMGVLIDDLLSFSRMTRQAMSVQDVELGPLVRDIIRELEPDTAGRAIQWRVGEFPWVEADAAMLRIVMANLISNALKFTGPRPQARVEIGSLPGQSTETVIFVRDNGIGFDMAYADKLFGVFQRLHRADEIEGTGIGLATVRRIIARHGGRTWAEGRPDQGATFYFALPYTRQGDEI